MANPCPLTFCAGFSPPTGRMTSTTMHLDAHLACSTAEDLVVEFLFFPATSGWRETCRHCQRAEWLRVYG